jgi:hypothetical protein
MGVKFQPLEYISIETDDQERRVVQVWDYRYKGSSGNENEYLLRRGTNYRLVFPITCFLAVRLSFKLDPRQKIPLPDATVIKVGKNNYWEYEDLKTYKDCTVFHGSDYNVIKLGFKELEDVDDSENENEEYNGDEVGDHYQLQVEAEVGLDTYFTSVLYLYVRRQLSDD